MLACAIAKPYNTARSLDHTEHTTMTICRGDVMAYSTHLPKSGELGVYQWKNHRGPEVTSCSISRNTIFEALCMWTVLRSSTRYHMYR